MVHRSSPSDFVLIPECWADTVLTQFLLKDDTHCIKAEGTQVAQQMQKYETSIGVIDDDKRKVPYFKLYQEIVVDNDAQLRLWKHPEEEKYLILLMPAVEKWLYHAALMVQIQPNNYNFPPHINDKMFLRQFCSLTKSVALPDNTAFRQFLTDILAAKSPPMLTLQRWIHGDFG